MYEEKRCYDNVYVEICVECLQVFKASLSSSTIHPSKCPDLVHAIHRLVKSEMLTAIIKAGVNSQSLDAPPEHFLDVVRNAKEMLVAILGFLDQNSQAWFHTPSYRNLIHLYETCAHPNQVYLSSPAIT